MKIKKLAQFHSTITMTDARGNSRTYRVVGNEAYSFSDMVEIIDTHSDVELKMFPLASSGKSVKKLVEECEQLDELEKEGIGSIR